jgi:hypothetical protein
MTAILHWTASISFCPTIYIFRPISINFGAENVNKSLLSDREFREIGHSENHDLCRGVDKIISVLSKVTARCGCKRSARDAVEN